MDRLGYFGPLVTGTIGYYGPLVRVPQGTLDRLGYFGPLVTGTIGYFGPLVTDTNYRVLWTAWVTLDRYL